MSEPLLTTSAAARVLGCSESHIRNLEKRGELHAQRTTSGDRLFTQDELQRVSQARTSFANREVKSLSHGRRMRPLDADDAS